MAYTNGYAEQCKDWSGPRTERINCQAANAAEQGDQATAGPQPAGYTRVADDAVHAVWQTALPLCGRTRASPEILSLGEQSGETPPAHLCAPDEGRTGSAAI